MKCEHCGQEIYTSAGKNSACPCQSTPDKDLAKDDDFYMENGRMVFTKKYLLRRGYCCGSGCRHCPYNVTG